MAAGGFGLQQITCHQAVHHHIGIAADRGREMGVVGKRQTVVSDIGGRIYCFRHGANGEGLYQRLAIRSLTTREQRINVLVLHAAFGGGAQVKTKLANEIAQLHHFVRVGHIVHTIHEWSLASYVLAFTL